MAQVASQEPIALLATRSELMGHDLSLLCCPYYLAADWLCTNGSRGTTRRLLSSRIHVTICSWPA